MAKHSMAAPDVTQDLRLGITFGRPGGGYGGQIEVVSHAEHPDLDPELRMTVYTVTGGAHVRRELSPGDLRELAGAFERAADHADAVRAARSDGQTAGAAA